MRSLIILKESDCINAFCEELKRYDARKHYMSISFVGAHLGRITTDELFDLTFSGKFCFKNK